ERSLFAPDKAGMRNASNFYDSQREGLQHDDGPPCFYLVPRSVLHAMLPAQRLYYTLIAYADAAGREAVYAHAPETLAREAPSVTLASDLNGALAFMFGTPVALLVRVTGNGAAARAEAIEEVGEDLEADTPETIGLSDTDDASDEDDRISQAAASDAGEDEEAAAFAEDPELRPPTMESSGAAALEETEHTGPDKPHGAAPADDYNDGYGKVTDALPVSRGYGAEHEEGEDAEQALATREAVPEMLPAEEAERAPAAQARNGAEDDEELEGQPHAA